MQRNPASGMVEMAMAERRGEREGMGLDCVALHNITWEERRPGMRRRMR